MVQPVICVDFDGVIHSYRSGWRGASCIPDEPVPGAIEWLEKITTVCKVAIYSSRSKNLFGRIAMKRWLRRYLNPRCLRCVKFPIVKPAAFLTIDDRCICFNGVFPTVSEILGFVPWNKKANV